ncbi:carcinine hydrolase/isopenicillin-N N-acyltransferase family protein [uncultured Endozoicomonas sp.]|uniref:carcinine hydrolase/isopenicillin-N N-acyltransferase family protein n=1 Tax=uncultured Endozoicomonas sp. TaxID=432652 RepID=UPI002638FF0F|nr:carcinine hydrolase/isopenicillin-N N-acyltransferase family protein [uncultured Endozoicomonas sp.]
MPAPSLRKPLSCLLLVLAATPPLISEACTTFASVGTANKDGGLIMAKNRDSLAAYEQLTIKREAGKSAYLGLFYNHSNHSPYPYLAAGINEHGLSVVQNESASINNANQFNDKDQSAVLYELLENYQSVAEVLNDEEKLFGNGMANFLIIGDKTEAILVEVGPNKKQYQIMSARENNNRLYHTNHYVLDSMRSLNQVYYPDSADRFDTIKAMMQANTSELTAVGDYYRWVNSAQNGYYDSIIREVTVASWIAEVPDSGTPQLHVRFTSPSQNFERFQISLTDSFWRDAPTAVKSQPLSGKGITSEPVGSERRYRYTEGEL